MSLLNALLLEPPKLDVYIALRNDPARGSGTEADPFSGNTLVSPAVYSNLTLTSATTAEGTFATVTFNHPYQLGDVVTISGASSVPDNTPYNGEFLITQVVPGVSFQYRMTRAPAQSSVSGLSCVMEGHLFDSVMRSLPADVPVAVHIGPGLFETRGYSKYRDGVSWRPRSGMKILGSGIVVTTLQLVGGVGANVYYSVIGVPPMGSAFTPLDSFEASGMTLDCNIAGQTSSQLTCGAVFVRGKHTRLRKLRVINFGRQGDRDASPECFALGVCGAEIGRVGGTDQMLQQPNCVVEECIVERPGLNSVKETTCIAGLAGDASLVYPNRGMIGAYHLAFQVRNCYIDCDFQVNPVSIESIVETASGSGIYIVTTRTPHGFPNTAGQLARISGVYDDYEGFLGGFNGSFPITYVDDRNFSYVPDPFPGAVIVPTPEMWVGRFPSQYVGIETASVTSMGGGNYQVTVRTLTGHYLVDQSIVFVGEITAVVNSQVVSWVGNGIRQVTYVSFREFTFVFSSPTTPPTPTGFTKAFIGVTYQGVSIDGGASAVMEGNYIANCRYGGPYHDTFSTKDCICRNNHYRSVVVGVLHAMDKGETYTYVPKFDVAAALQGGSYITHAGTTATFQSVTQTGVFTDWEVTIKGARILGQPAPDGTYNGYYSVVSPSNSQNQFTYVMPVTPSANADGSGTVPTVSGDLLPHAASLTHV